MLDKFAKKESPILGYAGFGGGVSSLLTLASGKATYIDDVFSTYLYKGNGSNRTITNGIDLSGEGGIVWTKCRNDTPNHQIDYIDGTTRYDMYTDLANSATITDLTDTSAYSGGVDQYNSDGYRIKNGGANTNATYNSRTYVSWTFRKCPGFFDVVTYTSQSGVTAINHNLGSVPGCIMVKKLNGSTSWQVYHRSSGAGKEFELDGTDGERTNGAFPSTPTDTQFFISPSNNNVFGNVGDQFVAYIFAHNDGSFGEDSDEAVIKCDHYNGSGSSGKTVDLGFEPQWVLIKKATATGSNRSWWLGDIMRGMPAGNGDEFLQPNSNAGESGPWDFIDPTPTGFTVTTGDDNFNTSGVKYNYIAIRRPHKPPSAGTDVFAVDTRGSTGDGNEPTYRSGFPVDMQFNRNSNYNGGDTQFSVRLTQGRQMHLNLSGVETSNSAMMFDYMNGVQTDTGTSTDQHAWMFRRFPKCFDVVCYEGNGTNGRQIQHGLKVVPEMVIFKNRDGTTLSNWVVYHKDLGIDTADHESKNMMINSSTGAGGFGGLDIHSEQTSTYFTLRSNAASAGNYSNESYVAMCFASLAGISKVGSYSGSTGNNINVDCGFSSGARFIMIKRSDSSGGWYVWDSLRGIGSGNDPYILLNSTANQVTNTDYIDPLSSGFTVTSSAPAALNVDGGTYIFLAFA